MAFAYCLDCGGRIYMGRSPWRGQPADCRRCGAELVVIDVNPLALDWADNVADEEWDEERVEELETS
jgi:hypothetical protein